MPFELPKLPYEYNALEPHFDAMTMEIHHSKHHQTYVTNLNKALEKYPYLQNRSIEELLQNLPSIPEDIRTAVRNNGGGHYNHSLFWQLLSPKGGGEPKGELRKSIIETFGEYDKFREAFHQCALGRFGSGWAWLSIDAFGKLRLESYPNQDNPIMEGLYPIVGLDVWEHAYYLKYQNRRADYIQAFFKIVNWEFAEERFRQGKKG
jgi:Fe-Mn family superoxide dismutase